MADVARGDGQDSSVFHVIKLNDMSVVAEYQGKPSLDLYSQILFDAVKSTVSACLLLRIMVLAYLCWRNLRI